jgi:hypothetical protein
VWQLELSYELTNHSLHDEEENMKVRVIVLSLGLLVAGVVVCLAQNPNLGTWKLNEAKSKFSPGAMKNNTVVYEAVGDSVKITVDGIDGEGKATHNEWTGKFDGKDYAVTGDATSDMRSYKQVNKSTLTFTNKKGGKVTVTGKVVVSADGKTRTVTTSGTDSKGKKVTATAVYDKQ